MAKKGKLQATDDKALAQPRPKRLPFKKVVLTLTAGVAAVALLAVGYLYAASPAPIRHPHMEHYHFRLQIIVDGKAVDLSGPSFQTVYAKGVCSGDLTDRPIHFHDQKDQFVHIHWADMTGGIVLKNYGWNFIGGNSGLLGYRLDDLPRIKTVPIHGKSLPSVPKDAEFWVYTGDEQGYQKRSFNDFKSQDLEKFFGKESNFKTFAARSSLFDKFFPKAFAHGSEVQAGETPNVTDQEELQRINNLLGNVVVFAQKNQPTDAQVKARFANLEPLSDSTCGG